jgi:transposase InsO family protein
MSSLVSPSVNRRYGLERVCKVWQRSRSAIYARRGHQRPDAPMPRRRGPQGCPCSDAELVARIRKVIGNSPFTGEDYRKIWARLRHSGIRTSKERTRRLMREHGLQSPGRPLVPSEEKLHDGIITTETPNEMWGTDMTTTSTILDGQAAIFIAIDHCTSQIVGIHASKRQDRFEALEPIRQGVAMHFGEFDAVAAAGLKLRHDHGSNYMADDFQNEIKFLGIESSPAFVREPECNGCAERFMRTLKENLLRVRHFETIDELRQALLAFQTLYNSEWLLQRHRYRTPNQVFDDLTNKTLATAA